MKFCQVAPSARRVESVRYELQRVRIIDIGPEFSLLGMHLVADPKPPRHEMVKIKRGILSIGLTFTSGTLGLFITAPVWKVGFKAGW